MVEVFDQPTMRGKYARVVTPRFSSASSLAADVKKVLLAEGINAQITPPLGQTIVMPLSVGNQLVVFSSDQKMLEHVLDWINILDRKLEEENKQNAEGVFFYPLRNARAEEIVNILNAIEEEVDDANLNSNAGNSAISKTNFIADPNQNALIYRGDGKSWISYLDIIRQMDKPVPSVLVELLLVEVSLSDQESTGIEFLAKSGDVTFSDAGGLSLGANGLNIRFDKVGETRAVLNAFYQNNRANIRSNPRLMVKSGEEASIDVGNEIPVITSKSQSTENSSAPVIQTIQYRTTGVVLTIEPTVHSSGYVDIKINQELSEAQQNSTSAIDSPTIFRRKLQTTVTLRDGGSVLLGGLISQTTSDGENGVGGLGKIPLLGKLFKVGSEFEDRTELMIMVIPYILETPDEAAQITGKAVDAMELLRL